MSGSQLPFLIPFVYLAAAVLIPFMTLLGRRCWCVYAAQLTALLAAGMALYGCLAVVPEGALRYHFGGWAPPIGIEFVYDALAAFVVLVINALAAFVLIHSRPVAAREFPGREMPFYTLCMLLMLGFNGMVMTGDLFNLYVFLEVASLSGYALVAIGDRRAPFAAFRYLIIGTAGGALYLLGVGFLYAVTGTLNMIDMAALLPHAAGNGAVLTALLLMLCGIGIKSALFPMHGWLPEAYTHANSTSSALLASIGTKVAAYILFRVLLFLFGVDYLNAAAPLLTVLGVLAAAGILYGSVMAIAQHELKRMLAYSSVAQISYILLGLSLANPLGLIGALLHVLNHAVMKGCLFMVAGNLRLREGHSDIRRFDDSYQRKYPGSMLAFTLAAISMIGLPPLAGFFSKWYLALGTIAAGNYLFLAVILASSLLNAVYFFRILEKVYLRNPAADATAGVPPDTDGADATVGVPPDTDVPTRGRGTEVGPWMLVPTLVLAVSLLLIGLANTSVVALFRDILPVVP
jgi:multicomponent Na+:H+ antiporter subunit D